MLTSILRKNIKEQILDNKGLFLVFLICQLVSFISFSYIHCHYSTMNNELDISDNKFSVLKMDIPQNNEFRYSDFISQLTEYTVESPANLEYVALKFNYYNHYPNYEPAPSEKLLDYTNYMPFMSYAYGEKEILDYYKNNVKYFYGHFFDDDDLDGIRLSAIVSDEFQPGEADRLKTVTIGNKEISVTGQTSTLDNRNSIIPFKAAEKYDLKPTQIVVKFDNSKLKGSNVFYTYIRNKKDLKKYFTNTKSHNEFSANQGSPPLTVEMYICVGILLLSILNFSYLYIYFLKKNKRNTDIYQICGCSQTQIKQILTVEIFLLNLIGYIICMLICRYLLIPFIFSSEPLIYFSMNTKFIIINFAIINILCYFISSPFIKVYSVLGNISKEY